MKKLLVVLCAVMMTINLAAKGEQVVLVDMDYIMSAIPAYETANEQLDQISKKWQKEVENQKLREKGIFMRNKNKR